MWDGIVTWTERHLTDRLRRYKRVNIYMCVCMYVCLFIRACLYVCLPVLYVCLSVRVCLYVCFSVSVCLYVGLSVRVCLYVCFSVSVCLYVGLSVRVCLYVCLYVRVCFYVSHFLYRCQDDAATVGAVTNLDRYSIKRPLPHSVFCSETDAVTTARKSAFLTCTWLCWSVTLM